MLTNQPIVFIRPFIVIGIAEYWNSDNFSRRSHSQANHEYDFGRS